MARKNPGNARREAEKYADKVLANEKREIAARIIVPGALTNAAGYRAVTKAPSARGDAALGAALATSLASVGPAFRIKKAAKSIEDTYPKIQEAKAKNAALRARKEK